VLIDWFLNSAASARETDTKRMWSPDIIVKELHGHHHSSSLKSKPTFVASTFANLKRPSPSILFQLRFCIYLTIDRHISFALRKHFYSFVLTLG